MAPRQREMMQRVHPWGIHERHMNALRMFNLFIYLQSILCILYIYIRCQTDHVVAKHLQGMGL